MITITFKDQFGAIHNIESDMPEKFAKREAENYCYSLGNDYPAIEIISIN